MFAIARPLDGLRSLEAGDILNHRGSHVRLVAADAPRSGLFVIKTMESAVSRGGVCEAAYTPVQLSKYKPLRYKYVEEARHETPQPTIHGTSAETKREDTRSEPTLLDKAQGWLDWARDRLQ
jgi:hypothetical protein